MIELIKSEKQLKDYLYQEFEDAGIKVEVSPTLDNKSYVGVKVDDFYNDLDIPIKPKSVDFVIAVDCSCNNYILYILEFKNHKKPKFLKIKDINEKFEKTINDFIGNRFKHIYLNDKYKYKNILLYLVSDVYNEVGKSEHHCKKDSLRVDVALSAKIFKIKGKKYRLQYDIPPNPIIDKCT